MISYSHFFCLINLSLPISKWLTFLGFFFRYFEGDDDDNINTSAVKGDDMEYQPAPGSPSYKAPGESGEESDDPLDSFMAGIEVWI